MNDQLLSGPDLTNSLIEVLLRFRQEYVALMSDVKQLFHQVAVTPEDRDVFRFLWWSNGDLSKEPEDHQMQVQLFGATSSPSCASFALRKTTDDNQKDVQTIGTLNRNFYVDDCLKSVKTVDDALHLVKELPQLLDRGGFHLTKWVSNRREVMASIPAEERAPTIVNLDLGNLPTNRALGVQWDVEKDAFGFEVVSRNNTKKDSALSIFDIRSAWSRCPIILLPAKRFLQPTGRVWNHTLRYSFGKVSSCAIGDRHNP